MKALNLLAAFTIFFQISAHADDLDEYVISTCHLTEACTSSQFESVSHGLVHYKYDMIALKLKGEPKDINNQIKDVNDILDHYQSDSVNQLFDRLKSYEVTRMTVDRPDSLIGRINFNNKTDMAPLNRPNTYYGIHSSMVDDILGNKISLVTREKTRYVDTKSVQSSAHSTEQHIDQITPAINGYEPDIHFFYPYKEYTEFNVITGVTLTLNSCSDCSSVGYIANEYDFGRFTSPNKKGVQSVLYGMYQSEGTQYIDNDGYNIIQLPYHNGNAHEYFIIIHRTQISTINQAH